MNVLRQERSNNIFEKRSEENLKCHRNRHHEICFKIKKIRKEKPSSGKRIDGKLLKILKKRRRYLIHVYSLNSFSTCENYGMILVFRLPFPKLWIAGKSDWIYLLQANENNIKNLQKKNQKTLYPMVPVQAPHRGGGVKFVKIVMLLHDNFLNIPDLG